MKIIEQKRPRVAPRRYYRGPAGWRETIPAIGIGVAAGIVTFYFARLMIQRAPLERQRAT